MKKLTGKILNSSMYTNSIYLMFNAGVMALFGFLFWTLAARFFTPVEVGLASTLISAIGLIVGLSMFGFNVSLIRYLPGSPNKDQIISSCFWLSGFFALILSTIFILFVDSLYPNLAFLNNEIVYSCLFIAFTFFTVYFNLIESIFIAFRKSKYVLIKNFLWSFLKVVSIFVFGALGFYGIFIGWYFTLSLALFISLFFIGFRFVFSINWKIVKRMFNYSLGNYLANIFATLPVVGLPLFVTHFLGAEQTAYFYMAWMIAALLLFVPQSVGKSYLSEGSNNNKKVSLKKAFIFNYLIIILGILVGSLLSTFILSFFGHLYVENATSLLLILLVSSLFYSYNFLMTSYYNLKKEIKPVILINLGICVLTFLLSYILLDFGLIGIGIAWFVSNMLVAISLGVNKWI